MDGFHVLALFAIGATIVWAAVFAFLDMAARGHAEIEDILLLSIAVLILRYASCNYPSARRSSASGATAGPDDMA